MTETSHVKPESQSVRGCAKLRELCQDKIFLKMDKLHDVQMNAIGGIDKKIAFMEGAASASKPRTSEIKRHENGKRDWGDIAIRFIISWGPWLAMIFGLGLISYLKSKGIL